MTTFLLTAHVLAAILAVGPVAVAASMFPRYARLAYATGAGDHAGAVARVLRRVCRVYALVGITVPVFGFATAVNLGVLSDTWLIVSIVLTALAAVVLVAVVLPGQDRIIARITSPAEHISLDQEPAHEEGRRVGARLAMGAGIFNLLWALVVVLMIARPGSTTGLNQ